MINSRVSLEMGQRDRFLKNAARTRQIFAVAGEDGLARVPSKTFRDRECTLLWSDEHDAQRWASVVAVNPRIKTLSFGEVLSGVLPGLAQHRRVVGLNWSSDPAECEIDPNDLAERLRLAALDHFIERTTETGLIWTLEDADGPAMLVSKTRPDVLFLPCWSDAGQAFARAEGPWRNAMPMEIPIDTFLTVKMTWLIHFGYLVGAEHSEGPGALELDPRDLRARFAAAPRAAVPA